MSHHYIIGIDEAGRGPIAGPVAVGAVVWDTRDTRLTRELKRLFPKVCDSKMLSSKRRAEAYDIINDLGKRTSLRHAVSLVSARVIDARGIAPTIRLGISRVLKKLGCEPHQTKILLDGGLRAPEKFVDQQAFIKGDETHLPIALASIVAKVVRDRHMERVERRYPGYGFEAHKGYGTVAHYAAIRKLGVSPVHRKTFIQGLGSRD